jgi:transposase
MELWAEIRRKVLVEGVSVRQICRDHGVSHHTVAKMLELSEPPGYRSSAARLRPKLGAFVSTIDEILFADRDAPVKQRHTAKRIYERLRDEHGFTGSESQVRAVVAERRLRHREVFVPLAQPPGEAQFDFGEAHVDIAGERIKVHLAVMSLPYSDAVFVAAYPRESTETFQHAHVAAFSFFGGVPTKIAYDNTSIAVAKVLLGPDRKLTEGFLRLQSHHLFTHRFCRIARGNEKGHVENLVGYERRNFLVPVPSFPSFADLNDYLVTRCTAELARVVRGQGVSKAERLEEDRAYFLALPAETFEARRIVAATANSLSLVRFETNSYSVPTAVAHHDVTVVASVDEVRIESVGEVVATHVRHWGRDYTTFDPLHYLALLERKPGAFDAAKPLEHWKLPGCFFLLRRRMEADQGHRGTRDFIKTLRLLERFDLTTLTAAVQRACDLGTTSLEAITLIAAHRLERPVELFTLDGHPHLAGVQIEPPDLSGYRTLVGTEVPA